jgi:pimeloyl-ACP methyl ester carboxylesterase
MSLGGTLRRAVCFSHLKSRSLAYLSLGASNASCLQVIYNPMEDLHKRLGVKTCFHLWTCFLWTSIVLSCSLWHATDLAAQVPPQTPANPQAHTQTLEGTWTGSLQAGDAVLHLVLHVSKTEYGSPTATLDSLDQGVYGIEVGSLKYRDTAFEFEIPSVNASFQGEISADHRSIEGTWSQGGANLPLTFHRQPRVALSRAPSGAVASAEGTWQGALETNGMRYRLQLRISHDSQGQLIATMDSIDQGINGFRASQVIQSGSAVHLELPAVRGGFDGTLNSIRNTISGTWRQNGSPSDLTFKRSDQILELRRPQTPRKPYPYREEELDFPNAKAGIALAGTLTMPRGPGPFPAAILLAGSGPLDRDEADSGHRPFLVLADYLTRMGIAVFRYDKRGVGRSTGDYDQATTADFAADAEAALAFLKVRQGIDKRRIGFIGHSEGGIIAPMIASRSSDVAWIVILAGPATKGEETLLLQSDLITRAAGMTSDQVVKSLDFDRESYNLVRHETDRAALESKLQDLVKVSGLGAGAPPAFLQRQIHWTSSPWFRYFLDYDPVPALQQTKCPVLALSGEKDLQVPPKENLPLAQKALETGGNKDFQVTELPGLNHQFQHCYMGLPEESRAIEETFATDALTTISAWILKRSLPQRTGQFQPGAPRHAAVASNPGA